MPRPISTAVDRGVRGEVVDFAARNADIPKLQVAQIVELGSQPRALAPFLKCCPTCLEETKNVRCQRYGLLQLDRAHCRNLLSRCFQLEETAKVKADALDDRLTFSSPRAYSLHFHRH
jgi:hypothetical protein